MLVLKFALLHIVATTAVVAVGGHEAAMRHAAEALFATMIAAPVKQLCS